MKKHNLKHLIFYGIAITILLGTLGALTYYYGRSLQLTDTILAGTATQQEKAAPSTQIASSSFDAQAYGIGSVSKMYTTAAVMKLVQEGRVDLDEPLASYLPDFSMADERYRKITPRMLLNHTSGLMGTTEHDAFTLGPSDTRYHDSILEQFKTQSLKADPGSYGVYCNDGFTLAELLIEAVTKKSYPEYLEETFFQPLGIQNTFTTTYHFAQDKIVPAYMDSNLMPYMDCHLTGSGGIYSTASDVAKFGQLFTADGSSILTQDTLSKMAASNSQYDSICYHKSDNQFEYGLGWDCVDAYPYSSYGIKALTKGGSVILTHAGLVVLPEQNLSACMLISGGSGSECIYALEDLILEILKEEGVIDNVKDLSVSSTHTEAVQPLPEEMRANAGYYNSTHMMKVSFTEDGTLQLETIDDDYATVQSYSYIGSGCFVPLNGAYIDSMGQLSSNSNGNRGYGKLYFSSEPNGKTYLMGDAYETIHGLGESAISIALGEKTEPQSLDASLTSTWASRDRQYYFLTESVYNSCDYILRGMIQLRMMPEMPGFIKTDGDELSARIVDASTATCEVDLPIMIGRDLPTYSFTSTGGSETLKLSSLTYIDHTQLHPISELPSTITMTKEEQAVWYYNDTADTGHRLYIKLPAKGAVYIYDKRGNCIQTSLSAKGTMTALLPEDGYLVFAGEKESSFEIR